MSALVRRTPRRPSLMHRLNRCRSFACAGSGKTRTAVYRDQKCVSSESIGDVALLSLTSLDRYLPCRFPCAGPMGLPGHSPQASGNRHDGRLHHHKYPSRALSNDVVAAATERPFCRWHRAVPAKQRFEVWVQPASGKAFSCSPMIFWGRSQPTGGTGDRRSSSDNMAPCSRSTMALWPLRGWARWRLTPMTWADTGAIEFLTEAAAIATNLARRYSPHLDRRIAGHWGMGQAIHVAQCGFPVSPIGDPRRAVTDSPGGWIRPATDWTQGVVATA